MRPTRAATAAALALALSAAAPAARAEERTLGDPRVEGAHALRIQVGERLNVCETGTLQCPAEAPICDAPEIATWSLGPEGLEFVGVSPGETLCSAGSAALRLRRVYRVTVVAQPPA